MDLKRTVRLHNHHTSLSIEDDFWRELKAIARKRDITIAELVAEIDMDRKTKNLSRAVRLFVLHDALDSRAHG